MSRRLVTVFTPSSAIYARSSRLLKNLSESFDGAQDERRGLILLMIFRSC
jgi:hypothetical protein